MSKLFSYLAVTTVAVASAVSMSQAYAADAAPSAASSTPAIYESAPVFSAEPSGLSRAEVLADLEVWKASGLAALQRGDRQDVYSAEYQRASALYAALRKSPHFAVLVQSIASKRGDMVAGATQDTSRAVQ